MDPNLLNLEMMPEVRLISVHNMFWFHNILMSISDYNDFFVTRAEKKLSLKNLTFFLFIEKNHPTSS